MVRSPRFFAVRAMRAAISPRFAIRTEENMGAALAGRLQPIVARARRSCRPPATEAARAWLRPVSARLWARGGAAASGRLQADRRRPAPDSWCLPAGDLGGGGEGGV